MSKPSQKVFKSSLRPSRHLGQHFLADPNIIRKIIEACELTKEDVICEIGPGLGALTYQIAPRVKKVFCIEKDRRFVKALREDIPGGNIEIIEEDILAFDLKRLPMNLKVIGNLPYNISSPIIEKIIENKERLTDLFATVQWEFGRRMAARPDTKDYGALSCFAQYHLDTQVFFKIKKTCFRPPPKVMSCFLRARIRHKPLLTAIDEDLLFRIIQKSFQQRRKTIINSLSGLFEKNKLLAILDSLNIAPQSRAENLGVADYVRLANAALKIRK